MSATGEGWIDREKETDRMKQGDRKKDREGRACEEPERGRERETETEKLDSCDLQAEEERVRDELEEDI